MRRLRNHRAPDPDPIAAEGFDRSELEGDAIGPVADEIPWLRPFGADIPGPVLWDSGTEDEPEAARALREARALAALGRRLDAVLLLRRTQAEHPLDPESGVLLAHLLEQGGDAEGALAELSAAIATAADPLPILVKRGELLARVGQPAEAERDLRDAVRQRPTFAGAHFHLGVTLLRRGRASEAADALREALRLAPDDPEGHYHLGEALEAKGELAAALDTLERAARLLPGDGRAFKLMGRLLDRLGRTDEAMVMHRRAREASIR